PTHREVEEDYPPTQEEVGEYRQVDRRTTQEEVEESQQVDWIPTQEEVEEVPREDLDDDNAPEKDGQGDQHMGDAPTVQQVSPYLFRRPRRYAMDSQ
ncbi:hypothetical protein PENSOL_c254G03612, partial [Penicillium solitum]